jgi:hypothetical protein
MAHPRGSIRLVDGRCHRLLTVRTGVDHTASMTAYSAKPCTLTGEDLCGYVLKKDSPSCGMTRVKVYAENRPGARTGVGVFTQALSRGSRLPVEEEGRLTDPRLRDNFIERVFAYAACAICSSRGGPPAISSASHGAQARALALDAGVRGSSLVAGARARTGRRWARATPPGS